MSAGRRLSSVRSIGSTLRKTKPDYAHAQDLLATVRLESGLVASERLVGSRGQPAITSNVPAVPKKILVAHRGASAYAPEHTLEAYQLALKQGADFVEQDLQVTRDNQLVCLHDLTLERTTNVKDVFQLAFRRIAPRSPSEQGTGAGTPVRRWYVSDFTLREVKQLDAGSWFNPKFKSARVPTFQEAIDVMRSKAGLYPETKLRKFTGDSALTWNVY